MAAVPIITMLLLPTLHFFFRHQAADEAPRQSSFGGLPSVHAFRIWA